MSKKYTVNQGFISLSTRYLEDGRHLAQLHWRCRRRRRRAYAPTSNTTSHDNHEKINSWVSFSFLYGYGAPLGGPSGCRSSAEMSKQSMETELNFVGRMIMEMTVITVFHLVYWLLVWFTV